MTLCRPLLSRHLNNRKYPSLRHLPLLLILLLPNQTPPRHRPVSIPLITNQRQTRLKTKTHQPNLLTQQPSTRLPREPLHRNQEYYEVEAEVEVEVAVEVEVEGVGGTSRPEAPGAENASPVQSTERSGF